MLSCNSRCGNVEIPADRGAKDLRMKLARYFRVDKSAATLVLSNLLTIVIAVISKWSISEVMWIYWGQSVIIGYFNRKRILSLKQFSTKGLTIKGMPVEPTMETKRKTARFFAIHYGMFHVGYFVFLLTQKPALSGLSLLNAVVCVATFFLNHRFSYLYNRQRDMNSTPNIGSIMALPYARIIPMHLTIILGSLLAIRSARELVLFLSLKTLADLSMHMVKHAGGTKRVDVSF